MLFKRQFDLFMSIIGIFLFVPLFIVIYITSKITMPQGPVIFKQHRIGRHGKLFTLYKFRTMVMEHHGGSVSVKGENRITSFGRVLRNSKLDELPELWNVLIGDMSFVGPRPDVPGYADKLIGKERDILNLRPGITGPATLKYANEEELLANQNDPKKYNDEIIFPDKVRINLNYLEKQSFIFDLKIIANTIFKRKRDETWFE